MYWSGAHKNNRDAEKVGLIVKTVVNKIQNEDFINGRLLRIYNCDICTERQYKKNI